MVLMETKSELIALIADQAARVAQRFAQDDEDERAYMRKRCSPQAQLALDKMSVEALHLLDAIPGGGSTDEPSVNIVGLAQATGVPKGTVSKRVQRLTDIGVVTRHQRFTYGVPPSATRSGRRTAACTSRWVTCSENSSPGTPWLIYRSSPVCWTTCCACRGKAFGTVPTSSTDRRRKRRDRGSRGARLGGGDVMPSAGRRGHDQLTVTSSPAPGPPRTTCSPSAVPTSAAAEST